VSYIHEGTSQPDKNVEDDHRRCRTEVDRGPMKVSELDTNEDDVARPRDEARKKFKRG
jgi:hypothetical protein